MLLKNECKLYIGCWGCHGEDRTQWESVLSTAGRNCCNYTAHRLSLWDSHTHTKRTWLYNKQPKQLRTDTRNYRFTIFLETWRQKRPITKSPRRLAHSWYDGTVAKCAVCIFCVPVFSFSCIDCRGQTTLKKGIQRKIDTRIIISKEQIINDPVIPAVDEASSLLCLLQWYQTFKLYYYQNIL